MPNFQKSKSVVTLFVSLCLVAGCKDRTKHLPPKVIEKVLLDLTLAESYSTMTIDSLHKAGTKNTDSLAVFYKEIFAHHKITQQEFEESLNWYKSNPEELDSAYARMQVVVTQWQGKYPAAPQTPRNIPPPMPVVPNKPMN